MGNTWLSKLFKGELGWKTVTSAVVMAVLVVLRGTDVLTAEQFDLCVVLAGSVGLVGIRDAVAKLKG